MKDTFSNSKKDSNNVTSEDTTAISYDFLNNSEIAARIDVHKQFISVSKEFEKLFAYAPEELNSQPVSILFPEEYQSLFENALKEAEEKGRAEFESQGLRKDGSVLYKKGVLIKGLADENSLIRFYYFVADITRSQLNKIESLNSIYPKTSPITFTRNLDENLSLQHIEFKNNEHIELNEILNSNKTHWHKFIYQNQSLTLTHLRSLIKANQHYEIKYEIKINNYIYLLKETGKVVSNPTYQKDMITGYINIEDIKNQQLLNDFQEQLIHSDTLDIFANLVKELALETNIDYVFIAEPVSGVSNKIRTLAFWGQDGHLDNFEYGRENTPCDIVFSEHMLFIEKDIQTLFPLDSDLVDLEVESYIGNSIINRADEVIGHIALMHKKPLHQSKQLIDKIKKYKELTKIAFDLHYSHNFGLDLKPQFNKTDDKNLLKKHTAYLYETFQYEYVAITELNSNKTEANTLVLLHKGKQIDNISYTLKNSPCENLLTDRFFECNGNATTLYKDFELIQSLGIEYYLGHVIYGKDYSPIGLIVLLSSYAPPVNGQAISKLSSISHFISDALIKHQYELELLSHKNMAANASEVFAYFDSDLFIQFYNDNFSAFFNADFKLKEDTATSIFSGFDFGESLIEIITRANKGKIDNEIIKEAWFSLPDGDEKYVRIKVRLISNNKYNKPFTLLNIIDLTDLRTTQKSLIESEEKFSHSIETSPDMIAIINFNTGIVIDANKKFLDTIGWQKNSIVGEKLIDIEIWQSNTSILKHISKLKHNKTVLNDEIYAAIATDKTLYFEASSALYKAGSTDHVYTVLRDISDRKKNEYKLKKQKARLNKKNKSLEMLNKINHAISALKNLDHLLHYVCDILVSNGDYYFCVLTSYEENSNKLSSVYHASKDSLIPLSIEEFQTLNETGCPLTEINTSYSNILFNDLNLVIDENKPWLEFAEKNKLKSCLILPLVNKDSVFGNLTVFSDKKHFFASEDINLLSGLSEKIMHAIVSIKQKTTLKITENILKKSEYKFKSAFGNAPVGMCICYEDGVIFDSNQSLHNILDKNSDDLFGKNIFDFIHKNDMEKLYDSFNRLIKNKLQHFSLEISLVDKNNTIKDCFCNCSRIIDKDKQVQNIIFHFQDISSRKQAERALQESEERFRLLYNGMPSMFLTISPDNTIRSINKYGAKHLGYDTNELTDKHISKIIATNDHEKNLKKIENCFNDPTNIHRWQVQIKHKDNSLIWVRNTARYINSDENNKQEFLYIVAEDISETQRLSEQLSYQATHDPLTDLSNRIEFERRLKKTMDDREHNTEHALCYMDLDNFKIINDTCGHLAGDELLRQLSILLKQHIRQTDMLARLGGDEFGILMENCSLKSARRTLENIRKIIEEFRFVWQDKRFTIGVSMGLVPITESFSKIEDILSAADTACYTAKDTGRNRIHIYFPNDIELNRKRGEMEWVSRIDNALEEDRFVLYYQEIQPLNSEADSSGENNAFHIELLIRLLNDDNELIPPGAFLSAAERYNIISKIDRWVIETTLRKLSQANIDLNKISQCNINLSGQSIGNHDFSRFLFQAINNSNIPSNIFCFEVTETVAVANLASAINFIRVLKMQGCSFALDDFGSGVSSFGYLKNLPVDYLKIDGAFVRDIADDPVDFTMVKSINDIGQVMNKKIVAEFVENKTISSMLTDIGVDYVQGYSIHKPEPFDNLIKRLKK